MAQSPHALVLEHLDLVPRLARKLQLSPHSSVWDDAIQAGSVALLEAAALFDPSNGAPFREYARPGVLGAIKDTLSQETVVRPSRRALALGAGAIQLELEAVMSHSRVPRALVDFDTESSAADAIDRRRRIAELRAAVRELPDDQREAVEATCAGSTVAQYAKRKRIGRRTAYDHLDAAKESLDDSPHISLPDADIPAGVKGPQAT